MLAAAVGGGLVRFILGLHTAQGGSEDGGGNLSSTPHKNTSLHVLLGFGVRDKVLPPRERKNTPRRNCGSYFRGPAS